MENKEVTKASEILELHDTGSHVASIAGTLKVSTATVYAVLRQHRPDRQKWVRQSYRSEFPRQIKELHENGVKQARIAQELGISRQYVSRVIRDASR